MAHSIGGVQAGQGIPGKGMPLSADIMVKTNACMVPLFPEEILSPLNIRKVELFDFDKYDLFCVSYSAGKDSLDCLLYLLELGVPKEKILLCHQAVDGEPGSPLFMDWSCTEQYVLATGKALGIEVAFQWRIGGFKGELLRENSMSKDVQYSFRGNPVTLPVTKGSISTRRKFPAKSANLSTRWCSASLKIDVFSRFLANVPEFKGDPLNPLKICFLTGERKFESHARAKYSETEEHKCNTKGRIVHQWRPCISWDEDKVWSLIEKYRIVPHPAYILGYGRTSCFGCVFCGPDHWAKMREIAPDRFNQLVEMEKELNFTIDSKYSLEQLADLGKANIPYQVLTSNFIQRALRGEYSAENFFTEKWELPAGAFKGAAGGGAT